MNNNVVDEDKINNCCGTNTEDEIRREVEEFYEKISEGSIKTEITPDSLYKSLGYDSKLLSELPEDIILGLSCGNPLEHLFVEDGDTILDLGCGTGIDIFMTRLKYPNAGTIYGLDKLQSMIDRATKVRDKKGFKDIEFKTGTLTEMPFPDNSIDKIISNCVINLEPDKEKVYSEIFRVLKPGGMFFISDINLKAELPDSIKGSENLYGT